MQGITALPQDDLLTIVIPTRNRPGCVSALVGLLRSCGVARRIIVADSSDPDAAAEVAGYCAGMAEVVAYSPLLRVSEKLIAALDLVETPYVVMLPDDDITFPHAIEQSLSFLVAHPDHVAAQGYVLDFAIHGQTFEIAGVRWFTPSIDQETPMARIYNLVRRFQPFLWAVFRKEVIVSAMVACQSNSRTVFQELTMMNAAVARGKVARLPVIYTLRGIEESLESASRIQPFPAFLEGSDRFFLEYRHYRDNLASYIRQHCEKLELVREIEYFASRSPAQAPNEVTIDHVLNLIHAILFSAEVDRGILNYTVQRLIGIAHPPIPIQPPVGLREIQSGDRLSEETGTQRRYLWRNAVFTDGPRDEIDITDDEIARVEAQLRHYSLG